jgi:hypothetical protein
VNVDDGLQQAPLLVCLVDEEEERPRGRAEIRDLPGTVTDLNNRWRSVENTKGNKVNRHSSMRGCLLRLWNQVVACSSAAQVFTGDAAPAVV